MVYNGICLTGHEKIILSFNIKEKLFFPIKYNYVLFG